jgi:DNA-binding transcriptional LysR family regulator
MESRATLNQLKVFLIAAETENFTEAAKRIGKTLQDVTLTMDLLEQRLGVKLFRRRGQHTILLDSGRALIPKIYEILDAMEQEQKKWISIKPNNVV